MSYFYLEIVKGVDLGKKYLLAEGVTSIGRSSLNNVALHSSEKSVSSHHAILYRSDNGLLLQDLGSTNGTFVNEQRHKEGQIQSGDMIGLGKTGPRLKLIISDTEMEQSPVTPSQPILPEPTNVRTRDDDLARFRHDPEDNTMGEDFGDLSRIKFSDPNGEPGAGPSRTIELERKIIRKKLETNDLHHLMKDGKRVDKIIERGNIGETQVAMLRSVHGAGKRLQRQWLRILFAVSAISICAISFFAFRAWQYKMSLNRGLSLRATMDGFDARIAQVNKNPDRNKHELDSLITILDKTKEELAQIKENVRQSDVGKFYSDPLEKTIDEVLGRFGETDYHIPREMVQRVKHHIGVYSGPLQSQIAKYIMRKNKYFPMIRKIFRDKKIPEDLAYVSMLESGFNTRALSHCGARGLWQFMPETGRRYGLRIDKTVDERLDPEKSTYSSARYFRELIDIFGGKSSMMLAMAAYNAGEGRILGALRKIDNPMRNRDFWYIYRMGYLAEETNEYIPRVIALLILSEHPEQYNLPTTATTPFVNLVDSDSDFIPIENLRNSSDRK
jgi:pSer/pThr/pTyr-binding forkhead associated (FHA) protein